MQDLLVQLINIYIFIVFVRIVLSWFPITPGTAMAGIHDFLRSLTEPVLGPLRRAIPPMGMFDISPMVLMFGLIILGRLIASG